jgi:hypothetical protein
LTCTSRPGDDTIERKAHQFLLEPENPGENISASCLEKFTKYWRKIEPSMESLDSKHRRQLPIVNDIVGGFNFEFAVTKSCTNRLFFTTKRGYMGVCPSGTKIDDEVAILFGGSVPYILRPHNSLDVPSSMLITYDKGVDDTTPEGIYGSEWTIFESEGIKSSIPGRYDPEKKNRTENVAVRKEKPNLGNFFGMRTTHLFIGECYVEGMMYGRAMDEWSHSGDEAKFFDLR